MRVEVVTPIRADPWDVWAVITDFGAYPGWNPFVLRFDLDPGATTPEHPQHRMSGRRFIAAFAINQALPRPVRRALAKIPGLSRHRQPCSRLSRDHVSGGPSAKQHIAPQASNGLFPEKSDPLRDLAIRAAGRVIVFNPGRELRWEGVVLAPWLLRAEHHLILEPWLPDKTLLRHGESFTGVATLLVPCFRRALIALYNSANKALARRLIESPSLHTAHSNTSH